jgi:hypothetical protein
MYLVSSMFKKIGIVSAGRDVWLDCSGLADGCIGVMYVYDNYEDALVAADGDTTLVSELEKS